LSEKNFVSDETFDERIQRLQPQKDDVLYSREGAILGLACLVPENVELCLGQRMMLMRTNSTMLPRFLMHYLNSPAIDVIVKKKTGGTASPHLNVGEIKMFQVPTPTIDDQSEIVDAIESRLSVCDKLELIINENLAKAQALRQSILKKAFAGRLVPQDSNNEPAEKLLERIKAAKANGVPQTKGRKRK
jgi:type I restriction enzyme S subunit